MMPLSLIAITNRHLCTRPFAEQIKRICNLNPKAIILREKDLDEDAYTLLLSQTKEICDAKEIPLIPHTFAKSAQSLGFTSIHLPLHILEKYVLTDSLTGFTTIGTSIHSVEEAKRAEKLGATYLTAGHIYVTDCKKGLAPRGLPFLKEVCQSVSIPVYAIGGIKNNSGQLQELAETGASGACIMSGMMSC